MRIVFGILPFFFRKLSFQFLFISLTVLNSQTIKIDEEEYKTILYGENEIFSEGEFARGSFFKNESDFIICKGRLFKGNPPKSRIEFQYKNETILNMGEFNNRAVELFETNNQNNFAEAILMMEALRDFDPVFFPARYNLGRFYFHTKKFFEAEWEFKKARDLIPEYYRTNLHLAKLNLIQNKNKDAEILFAKATKLDPFHNEAFIHLIMLAHQDKMESRANRLVKEAENRDDKTNAKIAKAILFYQKENYYLTYKLLKEIDFRNLDKEKVNYFKAMHYYLAVSSEKIFDKTTANLHYTEMLKYPFEILFNEINYENLKKKKSFTE
jgi:tetratricopeptide (TPR) repeat protein